MRLRSLGPFVGASFIALGGQAMAQGGTAPQSPVAVDEVVVTGSRIIQNGNNAPTPVTVVGAEQLKAAAPGGLADGLAQVPQFRSSSRPGTFLNSQQSTGAFLNLRGLGSIRTLVLLDGRRTPPTTSEGRTDINTYPNLLMKRVDIVTGGASAAYGSNAVSGVVNFILDSTFTGVKGELSGGISRYSDSKSGNASLAYGKKLLDGRAHFIGSIDYSNNKGVRLGENRKWNTLQFDIIPNPTPTDGRTMNLWRPGVTSAQFTDGGLISTGPLRGTQFLTGGVSAPFRFGAEVSGATMIGGDGIWSPRQSFSTPIKTLTTFGHLTFDVNDDLSTFAEFSSSGTKSHFNATMPNWSGTTAFTIFNNNAYLPANIRTQMAAANITSFALGRLGTDFGPPRAYSETQSWRLATGFSYKLPDNWQLSGSIDNGLTRAQLGNTNIINQTKLFDAVDAVVNPANGQIVCRSELTAAHGCAPLNIFGSGSASAAALAYIHDQEAYSEVFVRQTAAALSLRGEMGATWAGPIRVGGGFDYRRTSAKQNADAGSGGLITQLPGGRGLPASLLNKLGVYPTGNMFALPKVHQSVKEVYAEALVPLAADLPFAQALDLNAAYRYADYDTSGGVSSWKVGLTWQPIDAVRLRATRSRDVRAPTLNDLYSPTTGSQGTIRDPVTGANNPIPGYTKGNPDLGPELADTWTAGVVLAPTFAPGLSVSFDMYDIKMSGAIGTIGRLVILNQCAAGVAYYCQFIERLPDRTLVSTTVSPLNLNKLNNRGYDAEINYKMSLDTVGLPGQLAVRGLVAYLDRLSTVDPFGGFDDRAGVVGGEGEGTAKWQGNTTVTYTLDAFSVFLQGRYIGKGRYSNNYVQGGTSATSIDFMTLSPRIYADMTLKYKFNAMGSESEAFVTINNMFDRDPPSSPSRVGAPVSIINTNPTLYDILGRYYTAGVRFRF